MPNVIAGYLVGSFTQLYGVFTDLFSAQFQQHLVGGVVAIFWPALAKAPNRIRINRQCTFAGPFNLQDAAGCGLYLVIRVLLGDFEAKQFLPGRRFSTGAQHSHSGYQQAGVP